MASDKPAGDCLILNAAQWALFKAAGLDMRQYRLDRGLEGAAELCRQREREIAEAAQRERDEAMAWIARWIKR